MVKGSGSPSSKQVENPNANLPAPEGMDQMLKIVCSTIARRESLIFREPVNWKALGLTDYTQIVATPMDLGTIKTNIEKNLYGSIEEAAQDVRLVWTNCMLYNRDGSEYYHLADRFSQAFEEAYAALRSLSQHMEGGEDENRTPTAEARIQLSYDIFKINNIDMAAALTLVEEKCPAALLRKQDEVMLNFDALSSPVFTELNKLVLNSLIHAGGHGKKRKAPAAAVLGAGSGAKRR